MAKKSPCNQRKKNRQLLKKMGAWRTCLNRFDWLDLEIQDAIITIALLHGASWEAEGPTSTMSPKWTLILNAVEWYIDWEQFMQNVNKET